jgi:predicted 3-demethylubiquinone-9 3-methyltransferase (glyoxalase superfamily)
VQKITPFLWLDHQAEEAMNHYVSIFKNSRAKSVTRYGDAGPGPKGSVMTASFELEGQEFTADELWAKLSEGGQTQQCGWLKDKFGLS